MSQIQVVCPHCGKESRRTLPGTGKKIRCAKCGQSFTMVVTAAEPVRSTDLTTTIFWFGSCIGVVVLVGFLAFLATRKETGPNSDRSKSESQATSANKLANPNPSRVTMAAPQSARSASGSGAVGKGPDKLLGERYALLVGVAKYPKTSGLRDLRYTENDAEELAEVFRASGYRSENVVVMTQKQGADNPRFLPTAALIKQELQSLLRDRDPHDSIVVAFAGHGLYFGGADESFFCPFDGKVDDKKSLISLKDVYADLEKCRAGFKLLLNDACRNDPFVAGSRRATVDLDSVTRPVTLAPPGGLAVLFSCSENEVAWENENHKHGVFFHFVITGLRGEADLDRDGDVTLEELSLFTKKRVPDFVRAEYDGARQMPNLVGNTRGLVPLVSLAPSTLPPDSGHQVTINTTRPDGSSQPPVEPPTIDQSPVDTRNLPAEVETGFGMKLRLIPAGNFLMGAQDSEQYSKPDEKPQHRVRIAQPFYLGKFEVTQKEWKAVMNTQPWTGRESVAEEDACPATHISWNAATLYCRKLSEQEGIEYRLPTETEWEYACRATKTTPYSQGFFDGEVKGFAWVSQNTVDVGQKYAHHVGLKPANFFGLHDMHGNVSEWCSDWYAEKYSYAETSSKTSPQDYLHGPATGRDRVARGGAWIHRPELCRAAHRFSYAPSYSDNTLGFRVARSLGTPSGVPTSPPPPSSGDAREFTNTIGMKLMPIPAGEFQMGNEDSMLELTRLFPGMSKDVVENAFPAHRVKISKPFYLGKYEVTRGEFRKFVNATSYKTEAERDGRGSEAYTGNERMPFTVVPDLNWRKAGFDQTDEHPVVDVTWNDAVRFCEWLSIKERAKYRLPTEAEWEYACRGGTKTRHHGGDDAERLPEVGNFADGTAREKFPSLTGIRAKDGFVFTAPVGKFRANDFGLHDMHGNVWEWCSDWFDANCYTSLQTTDPSGPPVGGNRVVRGGSWSSGPVYGRSAVRFSLLPSTRIDFMGFRVVLSSKRPPLDGQKRIRQK